MICGHAHGICRVSGQTGAYVFLEGRMAGLQLDAVRKVYDNGQVGVDGATFEVADGELVVLVGPSGCGKSTLLRMIAGLEEITSGTLRIGDRVVNDVAPKDRDIAMVFQSYALYPHMTVAENPHFGLKLRGMPRTDVDRRVAEAAAMLGLEGMLGKRPREMSGGQRQRVALGRALVREPAVFLLDEPLSNLDAKLRQSTRTEIARLHQRLGATMVYVTHDQVEAMTPGQRIVVLDAGRIQQIDTPMALYERPANLFVAGFLGSPAMNVLEGELQAADGLRLVPTGRARTCPCQARKCRRRGWGGASPRRAARAPAAGRRRAAGARRGGRADRQRGLPAPGFRRTGTGVAAAAAGTPCRARRCGCGPIRPTCISSIRATACGWRPDCPPGISGPARPRTVPGRLHAIDHERGGVALQRQDRQRQARGAVPATLATLPIAWSDCNTSAPGSTVAATRNSADSRLARPRKWVRATISWPG